MTLFLSVNLISQNQIQQVKRSSTVVTIPSAHIPTANYAHGEKCLSSSLQSKLEADPVFLQGRIQANQMARQYSSNAANRAIDVIPVVFHVIHLGESVGTGTNISDAQINSAIAALNRDFRKDPTIDGGIGFGAGVDTEIEFCLATKDPFGNAHSGINRVSGTSVSGYAASGVTTAAGSNELAVKNLSRWDNRYYLNIWVVADIDNSGADMANLNLYTGGTLGFAYLPTSPVTLNSQRDGIVMLHCATGSDLTGSAGFRLWFASERNKALAHEVGHFLGLNHTFHNTASCTSETNCATQGDEICDTPPTIQGSNCTTDACTGTIAENYMDYVPETCMDMYTPNQKTVMKGHLSSTGARNALVNTTNCNVVGIQADFTANVTSVATGGSVTFTDLSIGATPTAWSWNFGGGGTPNTSAAQNPVITFNTPGTYTVTLTASSGAFTDTETKTAYITVSNYDPLLCDSMNNFLGLPQDTLTYYGLTGGGFYPGHNGSGITDFAEPFTVTTATEVQRIIVPVFYNATNSPTNNISAVVYADNGGVPGAQLGIQNRAISSLTAGAYNVIQFDTPISVNGNFWVGLRLTNTPGDSVIFGTAQIRTNSYSTTYYKQGAGAWGASSAAGLISSLDLQVRFSGSPTVSFTETALNINTGASIIFDGSASNTYSVLAWDFPGGSPNTSSNLIETVTYNTPGTYDATLFMLGGCRVDSLKKQVVVSNTTELIELDIDKVIKIYPNPANNVITVQIDKALEQTYQLNLIDASGKILKQRVIQPNQVGLSTIDITSVSNGIYQIQIGNGNKQVVKRLVVTK